MKTVILYRRSAASHRPLQSLGRSPAKGSCWSLCGRCTSCYVERQPSGCRRTAPDPLLPVAPLEFQGPVSKRSGRLNGTVPPMANNACVAVIRSRIASSVQYTRTHPAGVGRSASRYIFTVSNERLKNGIAGQRRRKNERELFRLCDRGEGQIARYFRTWRAW